MPCHTPSSTVAPLSRLLCALSIALSIALLTACGGSSSGDDRSAASSAPRLEAAESEDAAVSRSAALNTASLAAAEKKALAADAAPSSSASIDNLRPGQTAPKSAYTSGAIARKALAVRIGAYRFYNRSSGAHFYTTSEAERDNVIARLSPPFSYEGPAFSVASAYSPGLSPVHRFYNTRNGVHFYTISEAERVHVVATLPHYTYEGVAYHASEVAGVGLIPFHRFFVPSKGFHFYTASEAEKNNIIANLGATYRYEGVGYHVLDTDWRAEKLPHTGVTDQQCFQPGSDTLVACSTSAATGLNPQQDGHRAAINPMAYSEVTNPAGGTFATSDCVRDNVTGLVWEGKEPDGPRGGEVIYTNLGNGALTDASGYVAALNAGRHCGFSDWRLPTVQELLTLLDFGRTTAPIVNTTWFPNTLAQGQYWSGDASADDLSGEYAWTVYVGSTDAGVSQSHLRNGLWLLRPVRGQAPTRGPRYSFSTIAYGNDAANNVVNDAWTGLQWRRCEQGRTWSGITCVGTPSTFTHEQALVHARQQAGWRLPNIKELGSLVRHGSFDPSIDTMALPFASNGRVWSSSYRAVYPQYAMFVSFNDGTMAMRGRTDPAEVRLLRINP